MLTLTFDYHSVNCQSMKPESDAIGYGEFEAILAELHRIPETGTKAFRARLRVMRDAGIPSVAKPGKGARVSYRFEDLWEAHLALHLEQFGLPLERVRFVMETTAGKGRWFKMMRDCEKEHSCDAWLFMENLRFHASARATELSTHNVIVPSDQLEKYRRRLDAGRVMVRATINLSKLCRECESAFRNVG